MDDKITADVKTQKIKDPRRVEQGKRLAAISREAKAKKARERAEAAEISAPEDTMFIVPLVVDVAVAGGVAFGAYKLYRIKEEPEPTPDTSKKVSNLVSLD